MTDMNFHFLLPEWSAMGVLLILTLGEMFSKDFARRFAAWISLAGTLVTLSCIISLHGEIGSAFGGMYILDPVALFFKGLFVITALVVVQISHEFFQRETKRVGEFFLIVWTTVLGMFFLVSSNNFLVMFVSLEIVALSFYVLASYVRRDLASIEAGLKYLILGSVASAFFIFGVGLIYVGTGSTDLPTVRLVFNSQPQNLLLLLGVLFILSGIGFKIASVPFQLWVPDVYEGAPVPVVAFLSVGSKAAGFAILMRILFTVFISFDFSRFVLFSVLAALTILYGNLGALLQVNIKRLFGYSSIGHAGYLLIGIAVGGGMGTEAVLYYLMAYAASNLAAFLVIMEVEKATGHGRLDSYRGLAKTSPFLAGAFFVALLSLAGVPPLAGFFGKFLILMAAVKGELSWLALLGALTVAVSLYYYLNVVRKMYFEEPAGDAVSIPVASTTRVFLIFLILAILILGIWQQPFMHLTHLAIESLF